MKLSVMITSYNLEDYIDAAIESVVRQEMPCDWEILIGDDGSTDSTVEHINRWIEKYPDNIKLFCHSREGNEGKLGSRAAKNRAFLLEKATGDYLNFLDGDDIMVGVDKFTTQVSLLENPLYKECSCCASNIEAYVIPENRRYLMADSSMELRTFSLEQYWSQHYFHTNTNLFRKECKPLLLDSLYRNFLNDNFITFLLLQCGNILYCPNVWGVYNITGNGLWTGHSKVYGNFRNMQIYDLEMKVCPEAKDIILRMHHADIRSIRLQYTKNDVKEIEILLVNLPQDVFQNTLLLSKLENLTISEKIRKHRLFIRAELSIWKHRVKVIRGKLHI